MNQTTDRNNHERRGVIELSSRTAASALGAEYICCEWQLTNNADVAIAASFYVRTFPARLLTLACSNGDALRGHYHGSAVLHIPRGERSMISALLGRIAPKKNEVRVAVITRYETFTRIDVVTACPGHWDCSSFRSRLAVWSSAS